MQVTIEEAYAEPVARKKRKDRAFTIGILLGIAFGVIATILLNRAAEDDPMLDEGPVVELQPAMIPRSEQPTGPIATPEATA
jgi:hypothetical protein